MNYYGFMKDFELSIEYLVACGLWLVTGGRSRRSSLFSIATQLAKQPHIGASWLGTSCLGLIAINYFLHFRCQSFA